MIKKAEIIMVALILIIPIMSTQASTTTTEEQTFTFNELAFTDVLLDTECCGPTKFIRLTLNNALPIGEIGHPELPVYMAKYVIPKGRRIKTIEVIPIETDTYQLNNPILPIQKPMPLTTEHMETTFSINEIYSIDEYIFDAIFEKGSIGYAKGYPLVTIKLMPLNYNPVTNTLIHYSKLKVKITYESYLTTNSNIYLRYLEADKQYIKNIINNPEKINTYMKPQYKPLADLYAGGLCASELTYDYVIITSNELNQTGGYIYNWEDLISHRESYGGLTGISVTIENIGACSDYWDVDSQFNDTQAHIREFCKDAYLDWNTQYILMGGDWDTDNSANQEVPFRDFLSGYGGTSGNAVYASSIYFSNLDGNWSDSDNQGFFGGYVVDNDHDIYSELHIGRVPVSTGEHISNFIEKIFWYDVIADNDFIKNVSFFGGDLGAQWAIDSCDYMEDIRNGTARSWQDTIGFTEWNENNSGYDWDISTRIYYDWSATVPDEWRSAINNNSVCIINHLGHGNPYHSLGGLTISSLNNTNYLFIYTQECSSGRYKVGHSTAEQWLLDNTTYGAFGTVQNTGYGWGSGINTNGPNQYMQRWFWHYMFNASSMMDWQLGKAISYARDKMGIYCSGGSNFAWHGAWYGSTLFADPALRLKARRVGAEHDIAVSIRSVVGANTGNHVNASTEYTVNITIANYGNNTETNINVSLRENEIYKNYTIIPSLTKNNYTSVELNWTTLASAPEGYLSLTINASGFGPDNITINNEYSRVMVIGPDISISKLTANDVMRYHNQTFSATIQNLGLSAQTVDIEFRINGTKEDNTTISLNSSESQTASFNWNGAEYNLGNHIVEIHAIPVTNENYTTNQNQSTTIGLYSDILIENITTLPEVNTTGDYMNISCNILCDESFSPTITISGNIEDMILVSDTQYYYNKSLSALGYYSFIITATSNNYLNSSSGYFTRYDPDKMVWNQNTGTHYPTVTQAISASEENQTIIIPEGNWTGFRINKTIHLTSNNSATTIIDGQGGIGINISGSGPHVYLDIPSEGANYVEVSNLTIKNSLYGIKIYGGTDRSWLNEESLGESDYWAEHSHHNNIHDCFFNESTYGIYVTESQYNTIHHNTFGVDLARAVSLTFDSSGYLHRGYNIVQYNNIISSNYSSQSATQIHIQMLSQNEIAYNNFSDNISGKSAYRSIYSIQSKDNIIHNNNINVTSCVAIELKSSDVQYIIDSGDRWGNIVENNTIYHDAFCHGCTICTVSRSSAIRTWGSSRGYLSETIRNNTIESSRHGILCYNAWLSEAHYAKISNNTITRVRDDGTTAYGIGLDTYSEEVNGGYEIIEDCMITGYNIGIYATNKSGSGTKAYRCDIYANSEYGVKNDATHYSLDARNCYWGSIDGPGGAGGGNGDNISTQVLYSPYENHSLSDEPDVINPYPANSQLQLTPPILDLSITVHDSNGNTLSVYWYENTTLFGINSTVTGTEDWITVRQNSSNFTEYNTTYFWSVNVTDGTYWTNRSYSFTTRTNDTSAPVITIQFAGNPSELGGIMTSDPPTELGGSAQIGFYVNKSKQIEEYIQLDTTIDDESTIGKVWMNWLNGSTWTNNTYELIESNGVYSFNTSGSISVAEGYWYSFDIWANDTSINNNTGYKEWTKYGLDGEICRRYFQLGCIPSDNISYTPYYLDQAQYSNNANTLDRLEHDQGIHYAYVDEKAVGFLYSSVDDSVHSQHCRYDLFYWFNDTICIPNTIITNLYFHVWWNRSNSDEYYMGYCITPFYLRNVGYRVNHQVYPLSLEQQRSNISYGGYNYKLEASNFDITDCTLTDNNIYNFGITISGDPDVTSPASHPVPRTINNRSFTSFILFNVPDNASLGSDDSDSDGLTDIQELYTTYTNPFLVDTDNDGISDFDENVNGSDPNDYTETEAPASSNISISNFVKSHTKRHDVDYMNFTVDATNATSVWINITGPNGQSLNESITANKSGNSYWFNRTFDNDGDGWPDFGNGTYNIYIFANNSDNESKSTNQTFVIYPRADITMNNITNNNDISIITSVENWGQEGASRFHVADVSGNGIINNNDISIITSVENWGWEGTT